MPWMMRVVGLVVVTLALGSVAQTSRAEPAGVGPASSAPANGPARPAGQGVAIIAVGSDAHEEAFALARAVYASRLRPKSLDEVRARVLAGGPLPDNASRELRELQEVRASVTGEDAASRRLLTALAQQVGAEAILVVKSEPTTTNAAPSDAITPAVPSSPPPSPPAAAGDAGAAGNGSTPPVVTARLLLVDVGDYDAARYFPDPGSPGPRSPLAWQSTVTSLEGRFPVGSREAAPAAAMQSVPPVAPEQGKSRPFYASAWFWGALGAAALLGGAFYLGSRDTSSDTIHLQMRVPK